MVNRGASKGCITCRDRRVKCDEAKPRCQTCSHLGRECAGYGKRKGKLRFRDETVRFVKASGISNTPSPTGRRSRTPPKVDATALEKAPCNPFEGTIRILASPSPPRQDLAIGFFLTSVTILGRSPDSTRGFLDFVGPVLATERFDSALSAAVNAVSTKLWTLLGQGDGAALPSTLLNKALARLQRAIADPEERSHDGTVLAALVLQLYETISAVFGRHRADGTHREGASALLLSRGGEAAGSTYYGSLLANLLHSRVSLCIREGKQLPAKEMQWLRGIVVPVMPVTPSSLLDVIGVSIADLQHQMRRDPALGLDDCERRIRNVDARLDMWLQIVPNHWYPARLMGRKFEGMYQGACDVYPSIQVACIWDIWRIYRLIVVHARIQIARLRAAWQTEEALKTNEYAREGQALVDDICLSIPFFLGNRTRPVAVSDFDDKDIVLPSLHDLSPDNEAWMQYQASLHYMARDDHKRHAILQGPWRLLSILSYLAGLFVEERDMLRRDQKDWISEQFMHSLFILRLIPEVSLKKGDGDGKRLKEAWGEMKLVQDEARRIRDGLWTMHIL